MTQAEVDQMGSSGRLVQSAVGLAKAEIKLALAETRAVAKQTVIAVALSWASLSLVQVVLVLIAVTPVLASFTSWSTALLSITPCIVLTAVVGLLAMRRWRQVSELAGARRSGRDKQASDPALHSVPPAAYPSSAEALRPSETRAVLGTAQGEPHARAQRDVNAR